MMKTWGNSLSSTERVIQKYAQIEEDRHYTLKQKMTLMHTVRNIVVIFRW